jgi:transcriptional regulator with XRE-family HTH domain
MNIDFKIGPQLKAIRCAKKMSQPYVSNGICSINTLVRIEANTQSPSFELLFALVNRMGISIDTLIMLAKYERHEFYYTVKNDIENALAQTKWTELKDLVKLITADIYDALPVAEQQFIDIIKVEVAKFVDHDYEYAHELAQTTLAKTYNKRTIGFHSPEEMRLLNIILQFDRSTQHVERVLEALAWIEEQPEVLRDKYSWVLLLTGLMAYNYETNNWQETLQYAEKGYNLAVKQNMLRFIPNFLFGQGMSLYQLKEEMEKGLDMMSKALAFCLQFDLTELHDMLQQDIALYEIKLEDN